MHKDILISIVSPVYQAESIVNTLVEKIIEGSYKSGDIITVRNGEITV